MLGSPRKAALLAERAEVLDLMLHIARGTSYTDAERPLKHLNHAERRADLKVLGELSQKIKVLIEAAT